MAAYCLSKLGKTNRVEEYLMYIRNYKNPDGAERLSGNFLTKILSSGEKNFRVVTESLAREATGDPDHEVILKFSNIVR